MSFFNFGYGEFAGAGSGGSGATPQPIAAADSLLLSPGGDSDAQLLLGNNSALFTGLTEYTFGIWCKTSNDGQIVSISGDEDFAPSGAGAEDGNRFALMRRQAGAIRFLHYEKTYFADTPAPEDYNVNRVSPPNTAWNLYLSTVNASQAVHYMRDSTLGAGIAFDAFLTRSHTNISALSTTAAPMTIGCVRRGPAPRLVGAADYEDFSSNLYVHSAFLINKAITAADAYKFWRPDADKMNATAIPTDPTTVTLETTDALVLGAWTFAEAAQTIANGATITDRTGNGNHLTMQTQSIAWSDAANRAVGDAP